MRVPLLRQTRFIAAVRSTFGWSLGTESRVRILVGVIWVHLGARGCTTARDLAWDLAMAALTSFMTAWFLAMASLAARMASSAVR